MFNIFATGAFTTWATIGVFFSTLPKLPSLTDYGWEISNNSLRIVWDSDVNFKKVEKTVEWYTKGCGCKVGCSNNKCQCRKKNSYCGPGCKCTSCKNLEHSDLDITILKELFEISHP
jgi:hypothetical protein